ncbi:rac guanine nucleotide exchange factor JJ-like [Gigantopelta aegis]|uniref:rac guanine nucleotide exchange factor JJ-like n=1 Tax=Gigantopelta aegis TaxID=1735272 RepID=UPI001B88D425|nr:rac guanine nucleotide exchange factor JJ-like [Gigantopelta aegis]
MTNISIMERSEGLPFMRYPRPIPKRYEETRSPIIQDFTHQRILCYGSEIQKKVIEKQEEEKQNVLRKSEEEVWHHAESVKNDELKKLRDQLKAEHEKTIKKLQKEKEQALKEESLKVEMQMQKLAIRQVQEERIKGEEALAKALKHAEEVAVKELHEACSAIKKHERATAEAFVTNLVEKHTREMIQLRKDASEDKKNAILQVIETKKREKEKAVKAARLEEQKIAAKNLQECKTYFESKLKKLEEIISEKDEEIKRRVKEIEKSEFLKKAVEKSLLELRVAYQEYIERTSNLNRELTDIFLPSVYLDEVEKEALIDYEKLQNAETVGQPSDGDKSQNAETDQLGDYENFENTDTADQ